jgi:acid phosphatase type 7
MKKFTCLLTFGMMIAFQLAAQTNLVPYGSSWKYLDDGSDQNMDWRSTTFDDNSWKSGLAQLGYGDGDETTIVDYGPNKKKKYITTYFRKSIPISDASIYTSYTAQVMRDDGVVVYVNGIEVFRNNLPSETIDYTTLAKSASDDGETPQKFIIQKSAFITGTNVLAVEIHQSHVTSADISFDLQLIGNLSDSNYSDFNTGTNSDELLTRGPYLQMGNQSSVTLRWRTDNPTDSRIEVGTNYGNYNQQATNPTLTTEHEVSISGLVAGTKYFYRFGSSTKVLQSGTTNYFNTAPPENTTGKIRIAVFGDCGKNSNNVQTNTLNAYLNHVENNPAELLLLLGDNAYLDGTDAEYQTNFFKPYGSSILKNHVLFPAPGNHEYHTATSGTDRNIPYYQNFSVPTAGQCGGVPSGTKAYYSYDWGNIHFLSLDSYGTENPDNSRLYDTIGAQVTWVKKDLAATNKKWVIVYWHHPPYSMGDHNSDKESELVKIRQNFVRILERYGVDLVLTGHSHNYERSYLLNNYYGNEASFDLTAHTKSSSSGKYDGSNNSCPYVTETGVKRHGTVFVVSGSSGGIGPVQASWPHKAMPFVNNDGGMLYLEVEDNRLDAQFIRSDGAISDQFTIMQNVNKVTDVNLAAGSSIQLTASWLGSYKWSTGATTRTITVSPSSNTTYQVIDPTNCLTDKFNVNTTLLSVAAQDVLTGEKAMEGQSALLQVFPTLVRRGTRITVRTSASEVIKADVIDSNGRLVSTSEFTGTTSINSYNLPVGIYLLRLQGKGKMKTQKFFVTN